MTELFKINRARSGSYYNEVGEETSVGSRAENCFVVGRPKEAHNLHVNHNRRLATTKFVCLLAV